MLLPSRWRKNAREQFRVWLFHLEDDWATEFQEAIMEATQNWALADRDEDFSFLNDK